MLRLPRVLLIAALLLLSLQAPAAATPASPTPAPVPFYDSLTGEQLTRLFQLAVAGAVLLGLVGVAGLYLTREPR